MTRARELSKLGNANVFTVDSSNNLGIGSLTPDAKLDVIGIISATSFSGSGANLSGIAAGATLSAGSGAQRVVATSLTSGAMTAAATDADLSWNSTTNILSAPTLSGNITGTAATFTGNVSVGGTLTYDDVTNVDSVGVITARTGIKVGAGESISAVSGTLTYYGDGSNLDGIESGVKNFVASGAIANGATVVIKDDGTVGIVTQTTSSASAGTPVEYDTGTTYYTQAAYVGNGKVIVGYRDGSNSNHGMCRIGTISGDTVTFGTEATFSSGSVLWPTIAYDSGNDRVICSFRDGNESNYGKTSVGTISGTSISFPAAPATYMGTNAASYNVSAYVGNGKVVICYRDGSNGHGMAIVGTVNVSTGVMSFGTAVAFNAAATYTMSIVSIGNDEVFISYRNGGDNDYGTAKIGTVSGTSISFGTAAVFNSGTTYMAGPMASAYDPDNDKVVIAYQNQSNSSYGTARVATWTGTSISFPSVAVVFESAGTNDPSVTYDTTNNKVVIGYRAGSNYAKAISGTVSGTTITFDTAVTVDSTHTEYESVVYDPVHDRTFMVYANLGDGNKGTAAVFKSVSQVTNLTTENYIGIAGEAISNAATGKISVVGGVNSGQSGLTTAQTYYVGQSGILTTTADTPSVVAGTSISDTKILVWKS